MTISWHYAFPLVCPYRRLIQNPLHFMDFRDSHHKMSSQKRHLSNSKQPFISWNKFLKGHKKTKIYIKNSKPTFKIKWTAVRNWLTEEDYFPGQHRYLFPIHIELTNVLSQLSPYDSPLWFSLKCSLKCQQPNSGNDPSHSGGIHVTFLEWFERWVFNLIPSRGQWK